MRTTLLPLLLLAPAPAADIVWVGGVSDDAFDEANWDLSGSTVTTIDPNVTIFDNVVFKDAPTPVDIDVPGIQTDFEVGDAFTVTIDNSVVFTSTNDGIGGQTGTGGGPTVQVINGGDLATYFVASGVHLTIDSQSSAHLAGPATPINASTVDLELGAVLACTNETVADFTAEHLSKVTVEGNPAVVGVNLNLVPDGGTGCIGTAFATAADVRNGTGVNPVEFLPQNLPQLGTTWTAQVTPPPVAGLTMVAYALEPTPPPPAFAPFVFGVGELLVDLATVAQVDVVVLTGTHSLAIPSNPVFAGFPVYAQAVRVDVQGDGSALATALNAIDLVLGP